MEKDFDFNRVEKRMPYKTPDGFFDELETKVWDKVQRVPRKLVKRKSLFPRIFAGALAVAASVSLLLVLHPFSRDEHADGFLKVEQAFDNLSREDQVYVLGVYEEDVFMNE